MMASHLAPQSNTASDGQHATHNNDTHDTFFRNNSYPSHGAQQSADNSWAFRQGQLGYDPDSQYGSVPSWSHDAQPTPSQSYLDQPYAHLNSPYSTQQQQHFNQQPSFEAFSQAQTQAPQQQHPVSGQVPLQSQRTFSQELQHQSNVSSAQRPYNATPPTNYATPPAPAAERVQRGVPIAPDERAFPKMPPGEASGIFMVTNLDSLQQQVKVAKVHNFLDFGVDSRDLQITKSTIPAYSARRSRNEIKAILANNSKLSAKITKRVKSLTATGPKVTRLDPAAHRKLDSAAQRASSSSEESAADEDSDGSSSEEEVEQPPLPSKRPDLPLEATEYDTVKALWRSSAFTLLSKEDITKGLMAFWDIVGTIKDRWKTDMAAVKNAEEMKKAGEIPLLKQRVTIQRDMLERALRAAVEKGHADIIETSFGEHLQLMQTLAIFLQDRAKELDYGGPLSMAILRLLARCKTLTETKLVQTSVGKVLPRFEKRGDDKVKQLVKQINMNAAAASKKKKEQAKASSASTGSATASKTVAGSPSRLTVAAAAGVKRPRASEAAVNGQPAKKVAADGTSKPSLTASKEAKVAEPPAAVKPKPATSFFSALKPAKRAPQSADPQSSTTSSGTAAVKPASSVTAPTPSSNPPPAAARSATSIFAETMAGLSKSKEVEPVVKKETPKIDETDEERKKRLRKEARRLLRVSFRPDASLVEVRYFTHDPDEELGHDANQVKDAGDLGSEGRMFKLQHKEDLMDIDEDDESEPAINTSEPIDKPYVNLSLVDFDNVEADAREANYLPFGGGSIAPESAEMEVQQKRESETLMAIYTSSEDIPLTPKEAPNESQDSSAAVAKEFGSPPETFTQRVKTVQPLGRILSPPSSGASTTDFNLASALSSLTSSAQSQPQSATPNPASALEQLFAQHSTQAPTPQQLGQPKDADDPFAAILSSLQASTGQQQPQQSAPQPQQAPPPFPFHFPLPGQPAPQANGGSSEQPDLAGILALLSQNNGQQGAAQQPSQQPFAGMPHFLFPQGPGQSLPNLPPMPMMSSNGQFPGLPQAQNQYDGLGGNKRTASSEFDSYNDRDKRQRQNQIQNQWQDRGEWVADGNKNDPRNPNKGVPYRVVPCKYWREGKCRKGDNCTFKHE